MTQSGIYKTYTLPIVGGSSDHCPRMLVEHPIQGNIWIYGDSPYVDHNTPGCLKTVGSLYGHGGDVTYHFEDGGGGYFDAYMEIKWGETSATLYISALYHIYPTSYYYGIYEITDIPEFPLFKETTVNYADCTDELLEEILTPAPTIPACKYYIYENEDDPNYPGYTVMTIDGSAWVPSDYEGIGIFSRTAWTTHTGYKYYNYFHHIDTLSIDYDGIQAVWISGSYSSNTTFIANDAIILYCEETDTRLDIPGGSGYVALATEITSILQTGNNTVRVYLYNGPTFKSSGQAEYYENGGVLQCDNMYIRYV